MAGLWWTHGRFALGPSFGEAVRSRTGSRGGELMLTRNDRQDSTTELPEGPTASIDGYGLPLTPEVAYVLADGLQEGLRSGNPRPPMAGGSHHGETGVDQTRIALNLLGALVDYRAGRRWLVAPSAAFAGETPVLLIARGSGERVLDFLAGACPRDLV